MNAKEIGAVIKSRRQKLQIKQQDLADLAGVNINTIWNPRSKRIHTNARIMKILFEDRHCGWAQR